MLVKIIIVVVLLIILVSLGSGLVFLLRDKGGSDRTVKALTWRIGLSMALFILLMLAYATGLITPHGIYPQAPPASSSSPNAPAAH